MHIPNNGATLIIQGLDFWHLGLESGTFVCSRKVSIFSYFLSSFFPDLVAQRVDSNSTTDLHLLPFQDPCRLSRGSCTHRDEFFHRRYLPTRVQSNAKINVNNRKNVVIKPKISSRQDHLILFILDYGADTQGIGN